MINLENFFLNNWITFCYILGSIVVVLATIMIVLSHNKMKKEKQKEKKKEQLQKEAKENNAIAEMLEKMQQDLEEQQDETFSFEMEQEERAIISYQELLNATRKNRTEKVETKSPLPKQEIEVQSVELQNLESKEPEQLQAFEEEPVLESRFPDNIALFDETTFVEEKETLKEQKPKITVLVEEEKEPETKKFKNTEFISPVYGRVENNATYPTIKNFTKEKEEKKIEEEKEPVMEHRSVQTSIFDEIDELEKTISMKALKTEIEKSDEFLKQLKDFRNNL